MLSREIIKNDIADSDVIFYRGERIYENDALLYEGDDGNNLFESVLIFPMKTDPESAAAPMPVMAANTSLHRFLPSLI